MKFLAFLKSPAGNLVVFVLLAVGGAYLIHRGNVREQAQLAQMTKVESAESLPLLQSILRGGKPLNVPPPVPRAKPEQAAAPAVPGNDAASSRAARESHSPKPESKPRVLPISLFAGTPVEIAPGLSKTYAPFGRLISCETVITIESSKLDTPVIGLVTEDVWHNGQLIIPAGAEVHGRASLDRARERIAVSGKWVVVWRDGGPLNGTELVLNGIALDRAKDDTTGEFGLRDGSAGLLGALIKTDDWQEIKLFASTFVAGFAGGLQQLQNQPTALGGIAQVPIASTRNAALQGTADVLNAYAKQIQETIAKDGFFVRVPAGKQFYLYVTETIDQAKGTRGNLANAEIWRKNHEQN